MFIIIGMVIVLGSVIGGFIMAGGNVGALIQPSEFVIIGGAAIGSLVISSPLPLIKKIISGVLGTLKGSKVSKDSYVELLRMMYEIFQLSRREGIIAIEQHVENPDSSTIFSKYPTFLHNHHAVDFFCDTIKVILSGGISPYDLEDLIDIDLETLHEDEAKPPAAIATMSEAFPGLGIVAAVMGVVVTMGSIADGPEAVGHHVGAALVGTFLGVLLCYGLVGPVAKNMDLISQDEHRYLLAIKAGLLSFHKGFPSTVSIEYARRAIDSDKRPSYKDTEQFIKS